MQGTFLCGAITVHAGDSHRVSAAPNRAERGFCKTCGTHLFYHLLPADEYILPAGLFQDHPFTLTEEIVIDEKPAFYALQNDTRKLTGEQVFAQFASGQ